MEVKGRAARTQGRRIQIVFLRAILSPTSRRSSSPAFSPPSRVFRLPACWRAGNGSRRGRPLRPSTGLVSLAGQPPPRLPRLRALGASWLARNGHPPALPPVPRAHRPNAARPPVRFLRRLRLVRPQGLRVHRFTGWRAGGGAFRRGCARTGLRSWLRHPSRPRHPANLPAPPFAVRDCDASGSALAGLLRA